jgi:hypothetical protein
MFRMRNPCALRHTRVDATLTVPGVGARPPHLQVPFQGPGKHWVILLLEDDGRRVQYVLWRGPHKLDHAR